MKQVKQTAQQKLYREEDVLKMLRSFHTLEMNVQLCMLKLTPLYLPSDDELKEISQNEILYNDLKRSWWLEGAKYILNIIKIQ